MRIFGEGGKKPFFIDLMKREKGILPRFFIQVFILAQSYPIRPSI